MASEHILVIDDSIAIASLLADEILPLGGYGASFALSGEDGLERVRANRPDLILCDLEMPGINGLDVLRTLKNEGLNIAAIMMTAFGSEAIAAQALRIGVKDYIIKPFTTEEILASVERALTESRLMLEMDKLQATMEDQRQALVILQAIGQAIGTGLEADAILTRIILAAVYGGKARAGYVAGLQAKTGLLQVLSVANLPDHKTREFDPRGYQKIRRAMQEGKPTWDSDEQGHWVYLPLMRNQRPVGLMAIVSDGAQRPAHVQQLYATLAGFAAFVLENDKLCQAMLKAERSQ